MLEVEINQITTSPSSLRFGCVVRYGDGGPVRFVSAAVDDDVLDLETIRDLLDWLARLAKKIVDAEHQARDQGTDPLF